ncbi:competence protein TfoX [Sphingomonas sp. DBB INV C78]|uniref:TfoX/Sxy family protein n=1 Tax=Sphingomonas sp. DBB INV C78 TaxID=3349434 RepID=UPI0036D3C880
MSGLLAWIEEALAPLGTVTSRAMMGGRVLYCDGTIFAILGDEELWFKADAESDAIWDEAGCDRFTYQMRDRLESMNYRRAPGDVHDDPDEMRRWAEIAIAAGVRGQAKKKPRKKVKQP